MMLTFFTVVGVIVLAFLVQILWPWLNPVPDRDVNDQMGDFQEYQRLIQEREVMLDNLKDLELDFQMEKIAEADYQALKQKMTKQAGEIFTQIKNFESKHSVFQSIEKDLRSLEA